MHEAASLLVGGTLTAADYVMTGQARHACNLGGGLHHGFRGRASGFCIYNDSAVAIQYIQKNYGAKVLYIDTDAHHGDGVQFTFYDRSDVCTVSFHETGRYLFPGRGRYWKKEAGKATAILLTFRWTLHRGRFLSPRLQNGRLRNRGFLSRMSYLPKTVRTPIITTR